MLAGKLTSYEDCTEPHLCCIAQFMSLIRALCLKLSPLLLHLSMCPQGVEYGNYLFVPGTLLKEKHIQGQVFAITEAVDPCNQVSSFRFCSCCIVAYNMEHSNVICDYVKH